MFIKIKKMVAFVLILLLALGVIPTAMSGAGVVYAAPPSAPTGSGTIGSPYLIASMDNLLWLRSQVNANISNFNISTKYLKQTANIDLTGLNWVPIGDNTNSFTGQYDGSGYKIDNLTVTSTSGSDYPVGLFGTVSGATIEKLALTNVSIDHSAYPNTANVGSLVGNVYGATINNVYVTTSGAGIKNNSDSSSRTGGLVGSIHSQSATITNSYFVGVVSGANSGGLIGGSGQYPYNGSVSNSFFLGTGVLGSSLVYTTFTNCFVYATDSTVPKTSASSIYTTAPSWDFTTIWNAPNGTTYPTLRTPISNNAGLTSVATLSDTSPGSGGTTTENAIAWEVSVANTKSTLALADIVVAANATFNLYSDAAFTTEITGENTLTLTVGDKVAYIKVTAQDTTTTKFYKVTITRLQSNDANLSALALSSGTLSPSFAAATTSYAVSVANNVTSITLTPTVNESNATITVSGSAVTSGSASGSISLVVGSNAILVVVTAEDGSTLKSYTITVTRSSNDANLSALTLSSGTLSPSFAAATTSYAVSVANATNSITVRPTVNQGNATVTVSGSAVTSGSSSASISLVVGSNAIPVVVTAQDGTTIKSYTITVTRLSNNAGLTSVAAISDTSPGSGGTTTGTAIAWEVSVANTKSTLALADILVASNATFNLYSDAAFTTEISGGSTMDLAVGDTAAYIKVTAQDTTTIKFYKVTITRAASSNAGLSTVATVSATSPGALSGATTENAITWEVSVSNTKSTLALADIAVTTNATFNLYSDAAFTTEITESALALAVGDTVAYIKVTAQDTTTIKFYKVTITRVASSNTSGSSRGAHNQVIEVVEPTLGKNQIVFNIGAINSFIKLGDSTEELKPMDVAPIIYQNRTLLPVRFIVEPLGGTIDWNSSDRKVTIKRGDKTIELWIGKNIAKINGVDTLIDPNNPNVMPMIVNPGRTMLPLRFISEALGCTVDWEEATQKVTVQF